MPIGHVAPEIALIIGAALCLLAAISLPRKLQWLGALVCVATVSVAGWFAWDVQQTVAPALTFHGTWAVDELTTWATWTICAATGLVAILSPKWFETDRRHGEWYTLLLMSALGAVLLAGASDLLELVVAMLLASVTGYTLASFHRASKLCAEAGAKYFLLGALTNPLLFLGVVLFFGLAASTRYGAVQETLVAGADPVVVVVAMGLVVVGVLFELGAVPVHPWVPDVSEASPAPAAAFLTVVPKIGALVALARFVTIIPESLVSWRPLIAIVALVTMTVGNLAALWQDDVRRLLGWSSVSQAGYGLMAVVAIEASPLAGSSLVAFIVAYSAANIAAFGVVVSLRGRTKLADYKGLARTRPWHAAALVLALLSLTGIPPLVGFVAKLLLFGAVIEAGFWWLALGAVINTVVSLFYYVRVIAAMYLGDPDGEAALLHPSAAAAALAAALCLVALGLLAGVFWAVGPVGAPLP